MRRIEEGKGLGITSRVKGGAVIILLVYVPKLVAPFGSLQASSCFYYALGILGFPTPAPHFHS